MLARSSTRVRIPTMTLSCVTLVLMTACAAGPRRAGSLSETPTVGSTPFETQPQVDIDYPPFDWNNPLYGAIEVASFADAAKFLPFDPVVPRGLGTPSRILVQDPKKFPNEEQLWMMAVYNDPKYGVFIVSEAITLLTQQQLEARVDLNAAPGSPLPEWNTWHFSSVTIHGDVTAVEATSNRPEKAPDYPNNIIWLDAGREIRLLGPASVFTVDVLVEVANAV